MKVLNCYAGIGGNRKLWTDCEVTAVEYNKDIAAIYQDLYPDDTVIVGDAHEYLLQHYKEFDFIWCSPPCPTHSDIRRCGVHRGQYESLYPDMKLYQEIILLKHFAPTECKWVVENVKPYYDYLIPPNKILGRHPFWCNFAMRDYKQNKRYNINAIDGTYPGTVYGFNIDKCNVKNRRKILRNMVDPQIGLHIYNNARGNYNTDTTQPELFEDMK